MNVTEQMLLIKSIDDSATVELSKWTGKWYVASGISIGDGFSLAGITEHRSDPLTAIGDFLNVLCEITTTDFDRYLHVDHSERREYQWNGAAFTEVTGLGEQVYQRRVREENRKRQAATS